MQHVGKPLTAVRGRRLVLLLHAHTQSPRLARLHTHTNIPLLVEAMVVAVASCLH